MQKSLSRVWLSLLLFSLTSITLSFGQQRLTPHNYIDRYKSIAQQLMQESGVPASVILAVAIHESAYGNSRIARHLNNHFGIKGKNQSTTIRSAY
ncbi:MAG TPA: glucosaminidase domain-containing protein, partial [Sphingobacterium sp.]|nr:glucosaminidase domain-containing protein [Sphingobacterium sp.]